MPITEQTVAAIKEIATKYNVSYSDIAILFPYKQHKLIKYYFLYWLETALDNADIPYSLITASLDGRRLPIVSVIVKPTELFYRRLILLWVLILKQ